MPLLAAMVGSGTAQSTCDSRQIIVDTELGRSAIKKSGAKFEDIEFMLFTHFHVDHSADFPAYIKGGYFTERDKALVVIGPSGNALLPSAT